MAIPGYMLGESGLSFLGLGVQEPYASWGNMLQAARSTNDIKLHPWVLLPGFMIFVSVVAFQFVGDGLRDALDPRTVLRAKKETA
jgi:peptide/nickel transport system permease protein